MLVNTGIEVGPFRHVPEGVIYLSRYMYDNSPCIMVRDKETGEPLLVASVLVEGRKSVEGHVFLKDYGGNEGVEEVFLDEGLVTDTGDFVRSGFATIGLFKLEGRLKEAVDNLPTIEEFNAARRKEQNNDV